MDYTAQSWDWGWGWCLKLGDTDGEAVPMDNRGPRPLKDTNVIIIEFRHMNSNEARVYKTQSVKVGERT